MPESKHDTTPDTDQLDHEHEHGEHSHDHDHPHDSVGEGVLETTRGCGDKCAKCLNCQRRTEAGKEE